MLLWHNAGVADINQVLQQDVNLKRHSSDQDAFKAKVDLASCSSVASLLRAMSPCQVAVTS